MTNGLLLTAVMSLTAGPVIGPQDNWRLLANLPNREGYAGCFSGIMDNSLLVAGGANFPEKMPWEGGTKKWHDTVWALKQPDAKWSIVGKLPRALAYGISVTHQNGLVCVGGRDATRHYADVFRLEVRSGQLAFQPIPSLPITIANGCGALVGDVLYVAGGQQTPDARATLNVAYRMDLTEANGRWETIASWPGSARMLAVAAAFENRFWLIGGVDLVNDGNANPTRRYLKDVFRYDPNEGWEEMPELPHPIAAVPSPAPVINGEIILLGGDDGAQFESDPVQHTGFSKRTLRFDPRKRRWIQGDELPFATVTTPVVNWNGAWVVPTGEIRPGIRTNQIWIRSAR